MCGICGVCISDTEASVSQPALRKMTDVLAHRGPDGCGFLLQGNVGFGHRRLSIIDIDGGDQPIYNEDGRIGVVFNGEIYNYRELMTDLTSRGHRFSTRSDTEVIVHLYEEHGERCVDHLRGMFAFALWDGREGTVFMARDRLGIKPLFYFIAPDRMVFASELKSVLQDRSIVREVDVSALAEYLAYGYVPGDRCIIRGVSKVPPGHTLMWRNGRASISKYWDVVFDVDDSKDNRRATEALDDVLSESVRLHLRSDVSVGVLLSGGVDSSTIVALASAEVNGSIKTFSVGFAERDFNELAIARLTAERYGTEHHEILVTDCDVSILPEIVWHLDEPFADPSALPTYLVCREAAKHVKVCLSGDGADEIFGGYTRYRDAMSYRYVDWIPGPVRRTLLTPLAALMPQSMWGRGWLERIGSSGAQRYLDTIGVFSASECTAMLADGALELERPLTRSLEPYFCDNGHDIVTKMQHADQRTYLPDDILVKVDRMAMQSSLEVRPPFLDHKVVEFANQCRPETKIRNGVCKASLKAAMRNRIPPEVIDRRKMGFGIPIKHWFRGELKNVAHDLLLAPSSRTASFFEKTQVERLISGHQYGMRDLSRRIWSLLVFEQWCRSYQV